MSPARRWTCSRSSPPPTSPLFNHPNVVCTPHLGASTTEAQENVALQVAEQMSDYLLTGAVQNALNMPNVTAEEAAVMGPWIKLASHLGSFIGQMTDEPIKAINILYDGTVAAMNLAALNQAVIAGVLKAQNPDVNLVSAPVVAKEKGIQISTTRQEKTGVFDAYIKVTMVTDKRERSVAGTCFSDGKPRFIQIKGINIDAEIGAHMLYTTNEDVPGIIGLLGMTMGKNNVNIANFTLGRSGVGQDAIAILYLDQPIDPKVIETLEGTGMFQQVKAVLACSSRSMPDPTRWLAVVTLLAPEGPIHAAKFRFGLFYQAPGIYYPLHAHEAAETYTILAGSADWQAGERCFPLTPGQASYHPPNLPHAMRAGPQGFVAIWRWSGDISFDNYRMLPDMDA
jgi:quercetin dioxygenase-like cupin family protein